MSNYFHSKEMCPTLSLNKYKKLPVILWLVMPISAGESASLLKYCFPLYMKLFVNVVSDALHEHQKSGGESQHYSQQEGEEGNILALGGFFWWFFFPLSDTGCCRAVRCSCKEACLYVSLWRRAQSVWRNSWKRTSSMRETCKATRSNIIITD